MPRRLPSPLLLATALAGVAHATDPFGLTWTAASPEAPATRPDTRPTTRDQARAAATRALAAVDAHLAFDGDAGGALGKVFDAARGLVLGDRHVPRFREWAGSGMKPATAWPLSQLLAAELDLALLSGETSRAVAVIDELDHYLAGGAYAPSPVATSGKGQVRYYDDNAWLGLDLVQAYRVTGDEAYLARARSLVAFLEEGRDAGGGIVWREGDEDPSLNTCANAPTMQLLLALYAETGDEAYRARASELERVLRRHLRRPDGLYRDNVRARNPSRRDETLWSYNQGAALGAMVQLAAADPGRAEELLGDAEATARAALVRLEADPDWLWGQPPAFVAVFFRNLLRLDGVRPDPRYRAALRAYLARAEREALDAGSGAYERGGQGRYEGELATGFTLIDQAAMAQMLALEGLTPDEVAQLG